MASSMAVLVLFYADLLAQFAMYAMMNYLTDVWNESTTHAAGIINIWNGITPILGIVFALLVDAFMGNYYMLVVSRTAYTMGLGLLWMSTPPIIGPCKDYKEECIGHTQKALFFTALTLMAIGIAGHVVSLPPFFGLQTEDDNGRKWDTGGAKIFLQMLGLGIMFALQTSPNVSRIHIKSWSVGFGIPAICTLVATLVFLSRYSHYKQPELGNRTPCSVLEVEDIKIGIRIVPTWLTFIMIGVVLSIGNTYFIEQANNMNHKLGSINVHITIFLLFRFSSSVISAFLYLWLKLEGFQKTKYAPQIGMAASIVFSVLCCIIAAKVETRRLNVIRDHGLLDKPNERIPMSIFWLIPQFVLLGAVEGIAKISIIVFFRNQVRKQMHKYLMYFTEGVLGLGNMASVLSVYVIGKVSDSNGKSNWFQFTLNKSRLDRYYWTLAWLSAANIVIYIVVSFLYKYKENDPVSNDDDESEGEEMLEGYFSLFHV